MVVSVSELLSLRSWGCASIANLFGILPMMFILSFPDSAVDNCGCGCGYGGGLLRLLLFVESLLVVRTLDLVFLVVLGSLEGVLIVGDVQRLEWIRH
jgi:hypothetical protein